MTYCRDVWSFLLLPVYTRPSLSEKGMVPNGTRGLRKAVVVLVLDQHALASLVPVWELNLLRAAVFLAN